MSLMRVLVPGAGWIALLGLPLFVACNDPDPLPVFFDLNYQVGCIQQRLGCSTTGPQRIVQAVDGEDGFRNACSARNIGGGTTVDLSSQLGDRQSFRISNALVGDPNNVGASCTVQIVEGDNTYEGRCSTAAPAAPTSSASAMPCQLTEFGRNESGFLSGKLLCVGLAVRNSPALFRDVVKAGTFGAPKPAEFLVEPCEGL